MLIELDYPTPKPVELKAADTLLLIIDMENENAHPSGALFIGEPVRKIIPKIAFISTDWIVSHPGTLNLEQRKRARRQIIFSA